MSSSFYEVSIIFIPKLDKDEIKKKKPPKPNSLTNVYLKVLNKILVNQIYKHIYKYLERKGLSQKCKDRTRSQNLSMQVTTLRDSHPYSQLVLPSAL